MDNLKHMNEMDDWRDPEKEGNPDYKAIRKLHVKLESEYFDHEFKRHLDGYNIRLTYQMNDGKKRWLSVIEHFGSYGQEDDKLELWTSELSDKGYDPLGYLTPEEAYGIIQYWQQM